MFDPSNQTWTISIMVIWIRIIPGRKNQNVMSYNYTSQPGYLNILAMIPVLMDPWSVFIVCSSYYQCVLVCSGDSMNSTYDLVI